MKKKKTLCLESIGIGYDTGTMAGLESQAANFFGFRCFGVAHVPPAVVSHGVEEQHRGF